MDATRQPTMRESNIFLSSLSMPSLPPASGFFLASALASLRNILSSSGVVTPSGPAFFVALMAALANACSRGRRGSNSFSMNEASSAPSALPPPYSPLTTGLSSMQNLLPALVRVTAILPPFSNMVNSPSAAGAPSAYPVPFSLSFRTLPTYWSLNLFCLCAFFSTPAWLSSAALVGRPVDTLLLRPMPFFLSLSTRCPPISSAMSYAAPRRLSSLTWSPPLSYSMLARTAIVIRTGRSLLYILNSRG